ncbi:MAG: 2-oxo acid dehydrogenase subunit E2 [Phycisphaerales bacterium]|nr:2-oxo acid dehydrogenase subunit E2 [Phycisphaerales bacterium]
MAGLKQPADKSHFLLPDLGEGLVEAELIRWLVKAGETVKESQPMAEMQTDKALVEVPSPWAGTITELCGKEGDIIKVAAVLVRYTASTVTTKSATVAAVASAPPPACVSGQVAAAVKGASEDQGTVVGSMQGTLSVSTRFARRESEHEVVKVAAKALATPAVRRIARELSIDINTVGGTGRGGRVTATDVASSASAPKTGSASGFVARAVPAPAKLPPVDKDGVSQRIPFRGMRRKIAEALARSVQTAVHFTAMDEADVTQLDIKRREYSRVIGEKMSMLPFVMIAVCRALRTFPSLNANVDDAANEILIKGVINLGVAVDTDSGLMVPVIRDADRLSAVELGKSIRTLASKCKDRSISREESLGGTFTISNVGSYGGMFATPIINYPEVAILAAGRARERVLVKDGKFYAGLVLPLSISCDHRVVDGAESVRFLNEVIRLLENPHEFTQ